MTTVTTLADLLEDLGGISAARVRLRPAPGQATERDVVEIAASEGRRFELIDGVLVEKAMGFLESVLACAIASTLRAYVIPRRLGTVAGSDGMVRLFPHLTLIRMPDVAFVSNQRLRNAGVRENPVPQLVPDLAVEVLSLGNTPGEMQRKCRECFDAGVRLVWIFDPRARTVAVHTPDGQQVTWDSGKTLDGGDVLPGFALDLAALFTGVETEIEGIEPDGKR